MKHEAQVILDDVLTELRKTPYDDLVHRYLGVRETRQVLGDSGEQYQVQVGAMWDRATPGPLRVLAVVDGDFCRTWKPMKQEYVVGPGRKLSLRTLTSWWRS